LHANVYINLVRQLLKTIFEALIWRISLVKKNIFAFMDKPMMLFNYLFVDVNSSKQFKALVLRISLVIYVFLLSLGISLLHIPYIFLYILNLNLTTLFVCTNMVWRTPSSLMDLTMSPKVKTVEGERIGVRFFISNTLGVKGCFGALGWGLGILTSNSIIHTYLHKPNNKSVSV